MANPTDIHQFAEGALGSRVVSVARARSGGSTDVYRIRTESETFYLRLAEDDIDNLTSEAEAHRHLRHVGVAAPEVVHISEHVATFNRSVMITREVPGEATSGIRDPAALSRVLHAAGRDLRLLNSIAVEGFGWVLRVAADWPLQGERVHYSQFVDSYFPRPWPGALEGVVGPRCLATVGELLDEERAKTQLNGTGIWLHLRRRCSRSSPAATGSATATSTSATSSLSLADAP